MRMSTPRSLVPSEAVLVPRLTLAPRTLRRSPTAEAAGFDPVGPGDTGAPDGILRQVPLAT